MEEFFSKVAGFKPATLLKVTLLDGCFSRFLNCTNGTKSRKNITFNLQTWDIFHSSKAFKGFFKALLKHALQVLLMGSVPKTLPFFIKNTANTPFNEEYPRRYHVPSEDTSKHLL